MQTSEMHQINPENRLKYLALLNQLLKLAITEDENHGFCVNYYEAGDLPDNAYVGLVKYNQDHAGFSLFLPLQKDIIMLRNFYVLKQYRDLISVKKAFKLKADFFLEKKYEKFLNLIDQNKNQLTTICLNALAGKVIGFMDNYLILEHHFSDLEKNEC